MWDAINAVVEASGGSTLCTSVARQKAVARVESAISSLLNTESVSTILPINEADEQLAADLFEKNRPKDQGTPIQRTEAEGYRKGLQEAIKLLQAEVTYMISMPVSDAREVEDRNLLNRFALDTIKALESKRDRKVRCNLDR